MIIRAVSSLLLFCCYCWPILGQTGDSLVLVDTMRTSATALYADPIGSFYLIENKRSIAKYSPLGVALFRYSNNRHGDIGWMDTTDPFHIQVYYPDFKKLILLDNDLSELESYDLFALGLYDHPGIGLSYDNNFWLFDSNTGQIKKIDKRGDLLLESDNIFYELDAAPQPSRVVETKKYVLVQDRNQGIFVFDQFAKYIKQLKIPVPELFQIRNDRLLFLADGALQIVGLNDGRRAQLPLPAADQISHVQYTGDYLYTLIPGQVNIYQFQKKKSSE